MGKVTHLLTDTITIAHQTGITSDGDPTFGSQSEIAVRIEETDRLSFSTDQNTNSEGYTIISETELILSDRIWMPWDDEDDDKVAKKPTNIVHARFPGEAAGLYEVKV